MGKYNVGYHGPVLKKELDGIATLTQDPIAMENLRRKVENRLNSIMETAKEIKKIERQIIESRAIPKTIFNK